MASERTGVYPGTFDPVTSGHMEVVRRSLKLVDKLVIGPAPDVILFFGWPVFKS